ncbi:hypothetical protein ES703_122614 [subsurface metagenome]
MINAGNASCKFVKSILLISFIINRPTIISAGAVAYSGTIPTIGTNNSASRNKTPVTIEVNPLRPPCSMPDADSIYEVVVDVPSTAPIIVATASIPSNLSSPFILPFSSTMFAW